MNSISKTLLFVAIFLIIVAILYDYYKNNQNRDQNSIREKLIAKGLPTPAYANTEQLENILSDHMTILKLKV